MNFIVSLLIKVLIAVIGIWIIIRNDRKVESFHPCTKVPVSSLHNISGFEQFKACWRRYWPFSNFRWRAEISSPSDS
jgi:hypothetical protein